MKLYFVRHGKTQWNLEGRFQGAGEDSPLLEESIHELKKLGQHLADVCFDKIYSSDLKRAKDTATIIKEESHFPTDIILEPALREWRLGRLEGQKISNMVAIYPKQMAALRNNLAKFDNEYFDAESVYQATHRIARFVSHLDYQNDDTVLLVGHGASFTAAINFLMGIDRAHLREHGGLDNASITILESPDGKDFKLLTWNDTSYLEED